MSNNIVAVSIKYLLLVFSTAKYWQVCQNQCDSENSRARNTNRKSCLKKIKGRELCSFNKQVRHLRFFFNIRLTFTWKCKVNTFKQINSVTYQPILLNVMQSSSTLRHRHHSRSSCGQSLPVAYVPATYQPTIKANYRLTNSQLGTCYFVIGN